MIGDSNVSSMNKHSTYPCFGISLHLLNLITLFQDQNTVGLLKLFIRTSHIVYFELFDMFVLYEILAAKSSKNIYSDFYIFTNLSTEY